MDLEQQLQITVQEITYRSPDGGYSVLQGYRDADPTQPVTAVGDLGDVSPGEMLQIHGHFRKHPTYGLQFVVASWTPITPNTTAGIARYLGSGLIPGVGPALAARIVEKFDVQALEVISTQSARLTEVSGVGKRRAAAIAEAVRARKDEADVLSFMHSLGLGPAISRRIRKRYAEHTVDVLRSDPYRIASEVRGVGFRTADAIGMAQGYTRDDPRRAAGAVLHVLGEAADEGHTFLLEDQLIERLHVLDVPQPRIEPAVVELIQRELVHRDGHSLYAPPLYRAEHRVARRLFDLSQGPLRCPQASQVVSKVSKELDQTFEDKQLHAVTASLQHQLLVLTGGPGTGKTTTVRAIVAAHRALQHRVCLCSPTGRAAKRLAEATGHEAKTIHRLLEYNPATGSFGRHSGCPLEVDLLLVDEASMLDVQLADRLLDALPPQATLVLTGDVDQLPPISPGPVLRELINSGICHVIRLTEVFRQAQRSAIVRSAHAMLAGHAPVESPRGQRGDGDLYIIRAREPETIVALLHDTLERIRQAYELDPIRDVQVLTPMRRGPLGTERLNEILQHHLNPSSKNPGSFRPGDKVMQLRNDYEREVFNGDLGEVRRVESGVVFADMGGKQVAYEREALENLTLAYASTIHKVQGSEFPAIVIILHSTHRVLLTRALVYTAVTRAKRLVVILGDEAALRRAIGRAEQATLNCALKDRMQKLAQNKKDN